MVQTEIAGEPASSTPRKNWLFSVTGGNWEILKAENVWAVRSRAIARRIRKGDRLIFYVRGSRPPSFMGIYQVTGDWRHSLKPRWSDELELSQVIYGWEVDVKPVRLGTANVKDLASKLGFIEKKQRWSIYLRGTPANFKRPIPDGDYVLFLSELEKPSYAVSLMPKPSVRRVKPAAPKLVIPTRITPVPIPPTPSHSSLIDMICKIGEMFGFVVKAEDSTPNGVYRCDVTWRDYEAHAPIKVFEVEFSRNVDHALSSLAHAYDVWRPERLYLVVSDERDSERAVRLVEPRLRGAFSRLRRRLKVLTWNEVKALYDDLMPHRVLVKDLSER